MKNLVCYLFFFLCVMACTNEEDIDVSLSPKNKSELLILKQRDVTQPWIPYGVINRHKNIVVKAPDFKSYLGYGWKGNNFFDSYSKYLTFPVIDTKKLFEDYPDYFSNPNINESRSNYFSYANFERYVENSKIVNKITSGFSLNLILFSIGSKNTYTEIFTNNITKEKNAVFGEYYAEFAGDLYSMQYSSNIHNKILNNYLHKNFLEELYMTTPKEVFNNYGGFVLSNFVTGGKAIAIYTGLYNGVDMVTSKESDMNNDIDASVGFNVKEDSDGSLSGNLGFGDNFNNGKSYTGKFSKLQLAVKTIGGAAGTVGFSAPKEVSDINLNISPWLNSLNSRDSHVIIDVEKNGLIPLSEFIPEKNVKEIFNEYFENGNTKLETLQEPRIHFVIVPIQTPIHLVESQLITRHNTSIPLKRFLCDPNAVGNVVKAEAERLSKYFGVKITSDPWDIPSTIDTYINCYTLLDLNKLQKVLDVDGTIYLIDNTKDNEKKCYTIRTERIKNDYAMEYLLNSIRELNLDKNSILSNYELIAF